MQIFHIAKVSDWDRAQATGNYGISTLDKTLSDEGFIHASYREQVADTFARHYRSAEVPLVLLTIDTDRLDVPWDEEESHGARYPHIKGALPIDAVVRAQQLTRAGTTDSFLSIFVKESLSRALVTLMAMGLAVLGAFVGGNVAGQCSGLIGATIGLLIGSIIGFAILRRSR